MDRKTLYFEVLIYDYVSSIGGYRKTPLAVRTFCVEEEAVAFARSAMNEYRKIEIKQVNRIVNWQ